MGSPAAQDRDRAHPEDLTDPPAAGILVAARALGLDVLAAELVGAWEAEGIRAFLFKGRAAAVFLDEPQRHYGDIDLVVEPGRWAQARELLVQRGFRPQRPLHDGLHALPLALDDGREVDLHRRIIGLAADPARAFEILWADCSPLDCGTRTVPAPSPAACLLFCALHLAQHGTVEDRLGRELARALERSDASLVREAWALAQRLGAADALTAGLRVLPAGRRALVDLQCVQASRSARLRSRGAPKALYVAATLLEKQESGSRLVRELALPTRSELARRRSTQGIPPGRGWTIRAYAAWYAQVAGDAAAAVGWGFRHRRTRGR